MRKSKRTPPRQRKKPGEARRRPASSLAQSRPRSQAQSQAQWSAEVTRTSNALDLEPGVFTLRTPAAIARSLKRSAEASDRRKTTPFRSAMSMLNFYINRAGRNLPEARLKVLERAKEALRKEFGRG